MKILARTLKREDGNYIVINSEGHRAKCPMTGKKVKNLALSETVEFIDLQVDEAGELAPKKVDLKSVYKEYKQKENPTIEDKTHLVFYGIARINQLPDSIKQEFIDEINSMIFLGIFDETDIETLVSLYKNTINWNIDKYMKLNDESRSMVIKLICMTAIIDD